MQLSGVKSIFQNMLPFFFSAPQAPAEGEPKFLLPETLGVYTQLCDEAVRTSQATARTLLERAHVMRIALAEKKRPDPSNYAAGSAYFRDSEELDDQVHRYEFVATALQAVPRFVPDDFDVDYDYHTDLLTAEVSAEKEARRWELLKLYREGKVIYSTPPRSKRLSSNVGNRQVVKFQDRYYVVQLQVEDIEITGIQWGTDSIESMSAEELRAILRDKQ